jgi:phospholipid/cholesterol/gamma-HCH transport system permease protein
VILESLRYAIRSLGDYVLMLREVFSGILRRGINFKELTRQVVLIGVNSIPIVILTSVSTGMVLALQTAYGLQRFGAKNYVGNISGLAFVRELGPVLTAIALAGRVGAGIAAEISSMVSTEQVDAMKALGANPIDKLVAPKILASIICTPLLVVFADVVGVYGGLLVVVYELGLSAHIYIRSLLYTLLFRDVFDGLIKSAVFGFLLVSIACFKGLRSKGGTQGVGITTTEAVVTGSMVIFAADFLLTKLLLVLWSLS